MYGELGQRLSPKLVDAVSLHEAFMDLSMKVTQRGYSVVTQVIAHIFEFLVSVYWSSESENVDMIVYLPLFERSSKLTIGKRADFPFILQMNDTADKGDVNVWDVDIDHALIAMDETLENI